MKWAEVMADPSLQDLPYKIETNEWGQIVMSPANSMHSTRQGKIGFLLQVQLGGLSTPECPVLTRKGTKVPDVVWMSRKFWNKHRHEMAFSRAPEICVEVRSPSNSDGDIDEKRELYFEAGALEVWVCDLEGRMHFYDKNGKMKKSFLAPKFPGKIVL